MKDSLDGVLPVDKPAGPTSHDVVARARRALHMKRIGHAGTLDPFATGLLQLCLGRATRIAEYLSALDKRYHARIHLGIRTDTDDHTGSVLAEHDATGIDRATVEAALRAQLGSIMQTPPQYSAKKQSGERAYDMARAGREFTLSAVPVRIAELRVTSFAPPFVAVDVQCSTGTYIRAIARDLGAQLGVGAHLAELRRTAVGSVRVEDAIALEELDDAERVGQALIPPLDALGSMPRIDLAGDDIGHITHGRAVHAPAGVDGTVALAAQGELIAIGRIDGRWVRPKKVFL
ncbi:MAG TPA: tRNA pseudouridine(55) synthase TruB [Longimicrobiales bacterium]|nr:tRNA pseudouridine(55) synthase TruB [Longimicrobiales bacterium]